MSDESATTAAPAPAHRRVTVDPILSAMVSRAADTVVIPNNEVMNNSMVTEYWHHNTRFAGCYPNPDARKAPHLPRWFCRVHVGKGLQRYVYRGTLYQCALAADLWNIAAEPFRKLIVLGHDAVVTSRPKFNIAEAIARDTYRKDTRIREYFWKLLGHFEGQGLIINWANKRRKQGDASAKVEPYLRRGHLSNRNFTKVILEAIADLRVLLFSVQDQLNDIETKQAAIEKKLEPPVEYYDPTKEPAQVKVEPAPGEGAMPGKGVQTIRTWAEFEKMEAQMKDLAKADTAKEADFASAVASEIPAPENTKEPSPSIFG